MTIAEPIVLLVDDSENDTRLMRTVFDRAGFVEPLRIAHDGVEAINYLSGVEGYRGYRQFGMPTVVLLDLHMPRRNGFEVLTWIREQPALRRLPVYILSASNRPEDIARACDLGANAYLVKPGNLDGLMHLAQTLLTWIRLTHFAPVKSAEETLASDPHRDSVVARTPHDHRLAS